MAEAPKRVALLARPGPACDNLQSALKGVRDGCADALGVKDNDPRVVWEYGQEPIKRGGYGVIVEVRPC